MHRREQIAHAEDHPSPSSDTAEKTIKVAGSRGYPPREEVPPENRSWGVPFGAYSPARYVSPSVLKNDCTLDPSNPRLWADPEDISKVTHDFVSFEGEVKFSSQGEPLNPMGRTGLGGRGLLGKWGANFAADPVVTRRNPSDGRLEMIAIVREDCGEVAIPGGMVDATDPTISTTLGRELREETRAFVDMSKGQIIYRGYVDDPRNTDNAWMETTVARLHLSHELADSMSLKAGDDALKAFWYPLTPESIAVMYASHGEFLRRVLQNEASYR